MITSLSAGDEASGISLSPCLKRKFAPCAVAQDICIRIQHKLLKQIPAFQAPQLFYVYSLRFPVRLRKYGDTVFPHKSNDLLLHLNRPLLCLFWLTYGSLL